MKISKLKIKKIECYASYIINDMPCHVWWDFLHIFFSSMIHGNLMMEGKTMKKKKRQTLNQ